MNLETKYIEFAVLEALSTKLSAVLATFSRNNIKRISLIQTSFSAEELSVPHSVFTDIKKLHQVHIILLVTINRHFVFYAHNAITLWLPGFYDHRILEQNFLGSLLIRLFGKKIEHLLSLNLDLQKKQKHISLIRKLCVTQKPADSN